MGKAHLFFGIVVFIIFLITGRFMRADFPDKEIISQEFRLLMRSRHIYILLSSFIHILLGLYLEISREKARKYLQISGSFVLFAGTFLLIYAFFYETLFRSEPLRFVCDFGRNDTSFIRQNSCKIEE